MRKKTIAILMAAMLICGGAAGATMDWLTDATPTITNTFTAGNVEIELSEEHPTDENKKHTAKMIPGSVIEKDPKVTVKQGSEPCYLFVKVSASQNYGEFFGAVSIAKGWTELSSESGVYYRTCGVEDGTAQGTLEEDQSFYILAGDEQYPNGFVTVSSDVTKTDMDGLTEANYPTLSFQAYAVQYENITGGPEAAWQQIPTENP